MAFEGRVEGRVTKTGYELVQFGTVRARYTLEQARNDPKLQAAIERNRWSKP